MGKNWTQFSCKLLKDSRMKLIRPYSFGSVQTFKKFGYTLIWNNNVIHERGRPTGKWDLTMIIFVEYVRKLTIKFLSLFNFWICDTSSSSSFKGRNTLVVFFSWLLMYRWKSRGLALTSPTKLFTYKSCCFLTSSLISLLKVSNFDLGFLSRSLKLKSPKTWTEGSFYLCVGSWYGQADLWTVESLH